MNPIEWAKANPIPAGAIVIGGVVVIFVIFSNAGGGGVTTVVSLSLIHI